MVIKCCAPTTPPYLTADADVTLWSAWIASNWAKWLLIRSKSISWSQSFDQECSKYAALNSGERTYGYLQLLLQSNQGWWYCQFFKGARHRVFPNVIDGNPSWIWASMIQKSSYWLTKTLCLFIHPLEVFLIRETSLRPLEIQQQPNELLLRLLHKQRHDRSTILLHKGWTLRHNSKLLSRHVDRAILYRSSKLV